MGELVGLKECTTLCYIEKNNQYLLMYRNGKADDENKGKYIGVGGHIEKGETPEECVVREVYEETGLTVTNFKLRGLLTFVFDYKDEIAYLYTATEYTGEVTNNCKEGTLSWIDKDKLLQLPIWEGDSIFLRLLNEREDFFSLKLVYKKDKLVDYSVM